LEILLGKALTQRDEFKEALQRERADFVNFRKRTEREKSDMRSSVTMDTVARFLPILDDFERAIGATPDEAKDDGWLEGFTLIYKKFRDLLFNQFGVESIDPLGEPFDPNWHEAIGSAESDEYESGMVIEVLQKGYKLENRCIRVAMVRVAS
jgi:molecular chaperone GrpE